MTYIAIHHHHANDQRWLKAGADAFALHVAALAWCDEQLTDGEISIEMAERACLAVPRGRRSRAAVAALIEHGFWTRKGAICQIVDYLSYALPAEDILRTRARWAADQRRNRQHRVGEHALCDPKKCKARNAALAMSMGDSVLKTGSEEPGVSVVSDADSTPDSTPDSTQESTPESTPESTGNTQQDPIEPNATRPGGSGLLLGLGLGNRSPGKEVPNEPVPVDEVAGPYRRSVGGDCTEHNCKDGLDRRADGLLVCEPCRKGEKAIAKDRLDRLRAAKQVEEGQERRAASEFRQDSQTEEEKADFEAMQLHREEQDNEEIKARHLAAVSQQNGQASP